MTEAWPFGAMTMVRHAARLGGSGVELRWEQNGVAIVVRDTKRHAQPCGVVMAVLRTGSQRLRQLLWCIFLFFLFDL